jgi:hypothetical protein
MILSAASKPSKRSLFLFIMLPVLLVGFWLRIHQLGSYPPGVSNDEGVDVIDILHVIQTGNFPLYEDLGRPEPLYRILQAVVNLFYGVSVWSTRLTTSFIGLLTLAACYWAVTECLHDIPRDYRRIAALTAVIALTIAIGHITLSRSLYRAMLQPLFMLLTTGFLMRGLRKNRWSDFVLGGVFLSLGLYSYTAAYFVPLALGAVFVSLAVFRRKLWRVWLPRLVVMGLVTGLIMLPVILRLLNTPSAVLGRASEVSRQEMNPQRLISTWGNLFVADGDINPQYNAAHAPLVPTLFTWIFAVGLLALLLRIRQPSSAYIASLLILCSLPVLLSNEVPHGLRIIGEYALFPLVIAAAVGSMLVILSRLFPRGILVPAGVLILTAVLGTQSVVAWNVYSGYWDHADDFYRWRIFGYSLNHSEWFFRTDRRAFTDWIKVQNHPLLIPLQELAQVTTRTWLTDKFPKVKASEAIPSLPADTTLVVPWSMETDSLMLETRNYVLLQGDTIRLLPAFSQATQSNLTAMVESGERLSFEDGELSFIGYAKPVPQGMVLIYEDTVSNSKINFGGELTVDNVQGPLQLGATGQTVTFTVNWSPLRQIGHDYWSYVQLLTQDYQVIAGGLDSQILRWLYPPTIWRTGDMVPDVHTFDVPALKPGAYRIIAGVYASFGNKLIPYDASGTALDPSIATLGWIKVPQPNQPTAGSKAVPINATFDSSFSLDAAEANRIDDKQIKVSLYWHSLVQRPTIDATVFVHLMDQNGQLIGQCDARPWDGQYPTFIWDKDETVRTDCVLQVEDVEGTTLQAGMYTFPGPQNLNATQDGQTINNGVIGLGSLESLLP